MGTEAVKPVAESWWDWISPNHSNFPGDDALESEKKTYFKGLVERCVLVDSLSPTVTAPILTAAIGQFGNVHAVKFLKSPLTLKQPALSAILEMDNREQASTVESQLRDYLFMIGGMPRPARARRAEPVMLVDHPCNRKRKCEVKLISRSDPNKGSLFLKRSKVEQQAAEACVLYEQQRKAEQDLAKKHEENYADLKRKYASIKDNKDLELLRRAYNLARDN